MKFVIELDVTDDNCSTLAECFTAAHTLMTSVMRANAAPPDMDIVGTLKQYPKEDYLILCEGVAPNTDERGPCVSRMVVTRDSFDTKYHCREQSERNGDRLSLCKDGVVTALPPSRVAE